MFSAHLAETTLAPDSSIAQGLLFLVPLVLALLVFAAGALWYRRASRRDGESRELTRRTLLYFMTPGIILLVAGVGSLLLHLLRS
jgi:hypothetical protein